MLEKTELTGLQRKFLRGKAHDLSPVVLIGKNGLVPSVVKQIDAALESHELIKVKFLDFKDEKSELAAKICEETVCHHVGQVGHVAILYRAHKDPKKRVIRLPKKKEISAMHDD